MGTISDKGDISEDDHEDVLDFMDPTEKDWYRIILHCPRKSNYSFPLPPSSSSTTLSDTVNTIRRRLPCIAWACFHCIAQKEALESLIEKENYEFEENKSALEFHYVPD